MLPSAVMLLPTPTANEPGGTVEQYRARLAKADGRESTFTPPGMLAVQIGAPTGQPSPDGKPH
jgi:hypothetical protein